MAAQRERHDERAGDESGQQIREQGVDANRLAAELRRSESGAGANSPRHRAALRRIYADTAARPLWTRDARPTPQAVAMVALLGDAAARGLDARDYDAAGLGAAAAAIDGHDARLERARARARPSTTLAGRR